MVPGVGREIQHRNNVFYLQDRSRFTCSSGSITKFCVLLSSSTCHSPSFAPHPEYNHTGHPIPPNHIPAVAIPIAISVSTTLTPTLKITTGTTVTHIERIPVSMMVSSRVFQGWEGGWNLAL